MDPNHHIVFNGVSTQEFAWDLMGI